MSARERSRGRAGGVRVEGRGSRVDGCESSPRQGGSQVLTAWVRSLACSNRGELFFLCAKSKSESPTAIL